MEQQHRFVVERPVRFDWGRVVNLRDFNHAVAEARVGVRYLKRNRKWMREPDDNRFVQIHMEIFRDDAWRNWFGWIVRDEKQKLFEKVPHTRTWTAWDEHEAQQTRREQGIISPLQESPNWVATKRKPRKRLFSCHSQ